VKLNYPLTLNDDKSALKLYAWQKVGRCLNLSMFFGAVLAMAVLSAVFSVVVPAEGNTKLIETLLPFDAGLLWLAFCLSLLQLINIQPCFKQLFPPNRTVRSRQIVARRVGRDRQC
jgi:hypothetical protein